MVCMSCGGTLSKSLYINSANQTNIVNNVARRVVINLRQARKRYPDVRKVEWKEINPKEYTGYITAIQLRQKGTRESYQ